MRRSPSRYQATRASKNSNKRADTVFGHHSLCVLRYGDNCRNKNQKANEGQYQQLDILSMFAQEQVN